MPRNTALFLAAAALAACPGRQETGTGEPASQPPRPPREVPFELISTELNRFRTPPRAGAARDVPGHREALVFKLRVDRDRYDGLPPDIEPFFYVDGLEMRTFAIDRPERGEELILTFHAPQWGQLPDSAPMVLTTEHGAPIRDPKRFEGAPKFDRRMIVDRR